MQNPWDPEVFRSLGPVREAEGRGEDRSGDCWGRQEVCIFHLNHGRGLNFLGIGSWVCSSAEPVALAWVLPRFLPNLGQGKDKSEERHEGNEAYAILNNLTGNPNLKDRPYLVQSSPASLGHILE